MSQHNDDKAKLALIGVCRFRFGTDGTGITTLIGFHGCPLSCRYCLNPQSISVPLNSGSVKYYSNNHLKG